METFNKLSQIIFILSSGGIRVIHFILNDDSTEAFELSVAIEEQRLKSFEHILTTESQFSNIEL